MNLNDESNLDILKELGSMGAGNAATSLSKLLSRRVKITVPDTRVVKIEDVPKILGREDALYAAVYMEIYAEIRGGMLLIFSKDEAIKLSNLMLNQHEQVLTDMMISSLKECGNICINTYLNAISVVTGLRLSPTVPSLAVDMIGALLDGIGIKFSGNLGQSYVAENKFSINNKIIRGHFLFFPEPGALMSIVQKFEHRAGRVA